MTSLMQVCRMTTPTPTTPDYRAIALAEYHGTATPEQIALVESEEHAEAYRAALKTWSDEVETWLREFKFEEENRKRRLPIASKAEKIAFADWRAEQLKIRNNMIQLNDWIDRRMRHFAQPKPQRDRLRRMEHYIRFLIREQMALPDEERDDAWIAEMESLLR